MADQNKNGARKLETGIWAVQLSRNCQRTCWWVMSTITCSRAKVKVKKKSERNYRRCSGEGWTRGEGERERERKRREGPLLFELVKTEWRGISMAILPCCFFLVLDCSPSLQQIYSAAITNSHCHDCSITELIRVQSEETKCIQLDRS